MSVYVNNLKKLPSYDEEEEEEEIDFELEDVDEESLVKQRNIRIEKMSKIQEQIAKETKMKAATESMLQLYMTGAQRDLLALQEVQAQLDTFNIRIKALQKQFDQYKTYNDQQNLKGKPRRGISSSKHSVADGPDHEVSLRKSTSVSSMPGSWKFHLSHFRADTVTGVNSRKRPALNIMKGVLQNLTDLLSRLNAKDGTSQAKLDTINNLAKLVKSAKVEPFQYVEDILKTIRFYLCNSVPELRAASYRVTRFLINDKSTAKAALSIGLEVFLFDLEREQAIKLVRLFIDLPDTTDLIPRSVISAIAALSEQPEDKFKNISLLTLCELAIRNIRLISNAGALRCIFQTLVDGNAACMEFVIPTITFILDTPETRAYVNPSIDVEMVISNFTDAYNKGQNQEDRLKGCSDGVIGLLKTWSGLMILATDDFYTIRCIVNSLRLPYEDNKKYLLEALFEIFKIEVPKWLPDFVSARSGAISINNPVSEDTSPVFGTSDAMSSLAENEKGNLSDHFMSLILVIFIESGLLEALVSILEDASKPIMTRAAILIGGLLRLSTKLLPTSYCIRVQSLPKLFSLAATFDDENLRNLGSWSLSQIENLSIQRPSLMPNIATDTLIPNRYLSHRKMNTHNINAMRQIENIKVRLGLQVDDIHFKNLLNDSQVLLFKDYLKWNWVIITEIVQGPLLHPRRLEETIRNTKFVKRLLAFYRPNKHRFSDVTAGKSTTRYTTTGCSLFRTLLSNTEGVKYLGENKLFPQIAECFQELDPINGFATAEPIFSKERLQTTLTGSYFSLFEVIFKFREGVELLEKFKVLNTFYHLTELRSRDDLIKAIICCMDYALYDTFEGHPRIILSKVMTSGYKHSRLFATSFLRQLILSEDNQCADWGIKLLITQLYDPSIEVCEIAVMALDEACQNSAHLESLIALRPSLDHLSEIGNPLLFRFMSTSNGLQYLVDMDYIEKEMEFWYREGNIRYVIQVEISLSKAIYPTKKTGNKNLDKLESETKAKNTDGDAGICIPHFYGEIVKTEEGCDLIRSKDHFENFCKLIKEGNAKSSQLLHLKAALWAVGHIGSSSRGVTFLEESNVISDIITLSESSEVMSIRGTCYFVLGLISRNPEATEILEDYGWNSVSSLYRNTGICVPARLNRFLSVPSWKSEIQIPEASYSFLFKSNDPTEVEILKNVGSLSNQILANAASKALNKLKHENPRCFSDPKLFITVQRILAVYHYKFTARKFLNDLFDAVDLSEYAFAPFDELKSNVETEENVKKSLSCVRSSSDLRLTSNERETTSKTNISTGAGGQSERRPRKVTEGFDAHKK